MEAATRVKRAAHAVSRVVDDTVAILDVNSGAYYSIDEVGIIFMEMCADGATLGEISERVVSEYDVGAEEALGDMIALAGELLEEGLVEVDEA